MINVGGELWWSGVTGPATLVSNVVETLCSARCVVLCLPKTVPWHSIMREFITEGIRLRSGTQNLVIKVADGGNTPHVEIPKHMSEVAQPDWWPEYMDIVEFLDNMKALENLLIWVRGTTPETADAWKDFCQRWQPEVCEDGLVLVELPGMTTKNPTKSVISYDRLVSGHSVRLMCDLLADKVYVDTNITDARKGYTASVLAHLCDGNVELAADMAVAYQSHPTNPIAALEEAVEGKSFDMDGTQSRLWEAQLECLFPIIEHERLNVVAVHQRRIEELIALGFCDSWGKQVESAAEIEFATIDWLSRKSEVDPLHLSLNQPQKRRVSLLRGYRNKLAHHNCLTDLEVSQLVDHPMRWR